MLKLYNLHYVKYKLGHLYPWRDCYLVLSGPWQSRLARFEHGEAISLNAAEMFLAKYDPNGTLVWLKQSFSDVQGVGKKIKCNDRACIVAGEFEGTVRLDGSVLPGKTQKVIIARYDLSGTLTWTRELENSSPVSIASAHYQMTEPCGIGSGGCSFL